MRVGKSGKIVFFENHLVGMHFTFVALHCRESVSLTTGSAGSPIESATLAHSSSKGHARFEGGLSPCGAFAGRRPSRAWLHLTGWTPDGSKDSRP